MLFTSRNRWALAALLAIGFVGVTVQAEDARMWSKLHPGSTAPVARAAYVAPQYYAAPVIRNNATLPAARVATQPTKVAPQVAKVQPRPATGQIARSFSYEPAVKPAPAPGTAVKPVQAPQTVRRYSYEPQQYVPRTYTPATHNAAHAGHYLEYKTNPTARFSW